MVIKVHLPRRNGSILGGLGDQPLKGLNLFKEKEAYLLFSQPVIGLYPVLGYLPFGWG